MHGNRTVLRRWVLGALLLLTLTSHSCAVEGPPAGRKDAAPLSLWTIVHDSAKVHLLGSVHAMRRGDYPLDPAIDRAFEEADVLVVEVDLDRVTQAELKRMQRRGFYPPGETVDRDLSPATIAKLEAALRARDLPGHTFRRMKPWYLALNLTLLELGRLGFDPAFGIDQHYMARARGHKEILELESFEQQLELLSGDPPEVQAAMLDAALDDLPAMPRQLLELFQAWDRGEVDTMQALAASSVKGRPLLEAQMDRLLARRNHEMVAKISGYLNQGSRSYFVVIGALHMGGDDGIVRLLGQRFRVQQQAAEAASR